MTSSMYRWPTPTHNRVRIALLNREVGTPKPYYWSGTHNSSKGCDVIGGVLKVCVPCGGEELMINTLADLPG